MRAGSFDRMITVERETPTGTSDSLGQPVKAWRPLWKAWAAILHKTEDEAFAAQQRYAKRVVTFSTYWNDDLKETDRVSCDGRTYCVKGIREIGFREGLEIAAEWQD